MVRKEVFIFFKSLDKYIIFRFLFRIVVELLQRLPQFIKEKLLSSQWAFLKNYSEAERTMTSNQSLASVAIVIPTNQQCSMIRGTSH